MTGNWGGRVCFGGVGNARVMAAQLGVLRGQCRCMCPCCLQRWHRPLHCSSSLVVLRMGIVYILLISIETRESGDGRVDGRLSIGEGERGGSIGRWVFIDMRMAWRLRVDRVQVSQFRGSSWCMHGSRSSSGKPALNFSDMAGSSL